MSKLLKSVWRFWKNDTTKGKKWYFANFLHKKGSEYWEVFQRIKLLLTKKQCSYLVRNRGNYFILEPSIYRNFHTRNKKTVWARVYFHKFNSFGWDPDFWNQACNYGETRDWVGRSIKIISKVGVFRLWEFWGKNQSEIICTLVRRLLHKLGLSNDTLLVEIKHVSTETKEFH